MALRDTVNDYQALAEFRYQIRLFLTASEKAARSAGLEPEQFQLLLGVRGMPQNRSATIQALAERLQVRHNTVVERIDRLCRMGLLRRTPNTKDRRVVIVALTPRGVRVFDKLAHQRLAELRERGPHLVRALSRVIRGSRQIKSRRATPQKT